MSVAPKRPARPVRFGAVMTGWPKRTRRSLWRRVVLSTSVLTGKKPGQMRKQAPVVIPALAEVSSSKLTALASARRFWARDWEAQLGVRGILEFLGDRAKGCRGFTIANLCSRLGWALA